MLRLSFVLFLGLFRAAPVYGDTFYVVAHRGVVEDGLTENSMPSLEETIRRGYTHIEVDLRATKDGHAVYLHDRSLRRTLGISKNIDDLTLAEFRALVPEEKAPSFETFCAAAAGRIDLMPDVKTVPPELVALFTVSLRSSMTRHGLMQRALFIGDRDITKGFLGEGLLAWQESPEASRTSRKAPERLYFVFGHGGDFTQENIDGYHAMGLKVIASINTFHYLRGDPIRDGLAHIEQMFAIGIDGLQIDSVYDEAVFNQLAKDSRGSK